MRRGSDMNPIIKCNYNWIKLMMSSTSFKNKSSGNFWGMKHVRTHCYYVIFKWILSGKQGKLGKCMKPVTHNGKWIIIQQDLHQPSVVTSTNLRFHFGVVHLLYKLICDLQSCFFLLSISTTACIDGISRWALSANDELIITIN